MKVSYCIVCKHFIPLKTQHIGKVYSVNSCALTKRQIACILSCDDREEVIAGIIETITPLPSEDQDDQKKKKKKK